LPQKPLKETLSSFIEKRIAMGLRRQAREIALQIMFQQEFNPGLSAEQAASLYLDNFEITPEAKEYAVKLVEGTIQHADEIRRLIDAHSTHWKLDRMALVDRNILKIATFELKYLHVDIPSNVAINEAIEIGKKFGSQESGAFLNGVLDNIAKSLHQ